MHNENEKHFLKGAWIVWIPFLETRGLPDFCKLMDRYGQWAEFGV